MWDIISLAGAVMSAVMEHVCTVTGLPRSYIRRGRGCGGKGSVCLGGTCAAWGYLGASSLVAAVLG